MLSMAYCSNCGDAIANTVRFCAGCGRAVSDALETQLPPKTDSAAPLGLDDVPWWLGWLVFPLGILTLGLSTIVYPIWAYRRGLRDGVGREPTEHPRKDMGWTTVGLALAHIICWWFAGIRLTTLWYRYGLRVGARDGAASPRFTSLRALTSIPLTVAAVVGLTVLIALAANGSSNGEAEAARPVQATARPRATTIGPKLTGAEAAGKAEAVYYQTWTGEELVSTRCEPEDYSNNSHSWIVRCTVLDNWWRVRVDDRTGRVSDIE